MALTSFPGPSINTSLLKHQEIGAAELCSTFSLKKRLLKGWREQLPLAHTHIQIFFYICISILKFTSETFKRRLDELTDSSSRKTTAIPHFSAALSSGAAHKHPSARASLPPPARSRSEQRDPRTGNKPGALGLSSLHRRVMEPKPQHLRQVWRVQVSRCLAARLRSLPRRGARGCRADRGTALERDGGVKRLWWGAGDTAVVPEDERLLCPRLSLKAIH